MAKKDKKEFKVEIKATHGYLNEKKNKVVATMSFDDSEPKLNIRTCWTDKDTGELRTGSGITLSDEEADNLYELLEKRSRGKLPKMNADGRVAVDFSDIFSSAAGIMDKREQGYSTEDGFIKLLRKSGCKLNKK